MTTAERAEAFALVAPFRDDLNKVVAGQHHEEDKILKNHPEAFDSEGKQIKSVYELKLSKEEDQRLTVQELAVSKVEAGAEDAISKGMKEKHPTGDKIPDEHRYDDLAHSVVQSMKRNAIENARQDPQEDHSIIHKPLSLPVPEQQLIKGR